MQKISVDRFPQTEGFVDTPKKPESLDLFWAFNSALTFLETVGPLADYIEVVKVGWRQMRTLEGVKPVYPLCCLFRIVVSHPALADKGQVLVDIGIRSCDVETMALKLRQSVKAALVIASGEYECQREELEEMLDLIHVGRPA